MITQQEIDQAFSEYKNLYGGKKEDYFALLYLCKEFKSTPEEMQKRIAFGGNDYGIDGFYIDAYKRILLLYQFKWTENHLLFRESLKRLIDSGIVHIFGNQPNSNKQNDLINNLKSQIFENKSVIDKVLVRCVFNGKVADADRSEVLDSLREQLEEKNYIVDQYFDRQVEFRVQFFSNKEGAGHLPSSPKPEFSVDFEYSAEITAEDENTLYSGFIKLMDLYRIYKQLDRRFFERNIRFGYPPDRAPNRAIRQTLKKIVLDEKESPEKFLFKHNGITLSVQDLKKENSKTVLIHPRLLNGAQTVSSLSTFVEENRDNPLIEKNNHLLEKVKVPAKIIKTNSDDFIVEITICNNKQNPVESWHLRANDLIQLTLQEKFREDLGIYYERQENSFSNLTNEDLEELGILEHKSIEIKRLAQTFLAVQGEISKMTNLSKVFEDQRTYDKTFAQKYAEGDLRKIVLGYKMQFMIRSIIREISESDKYAYFDKARNLVWSLLIQGILNHKDLNKICEQYGKTLTKEVGYKEILKSLTSNKVKTVIGQAILRGNRQKDVADEKYEFLKTNEFYKLCMDIAYEKFSWIKQSF
jgi:hypothetical protein